MLTIKYQVLINNNKLRVILPDNYENIAEPIVCVKTNKLKLHLDDDWDILTNPTVIQTTPKETIYTSTIFKEKGWFSKEEKIKVLVNIKRL